MNRTVLKVLDLITRHKGGITADMFPVGFRLAARIFDLRDIGYDIVTVKRDAGNPCARYVLKARPKS